MKRTLRQVIADWYLNSPDWPFEVMANDQVDDFSRDAREDGNAWTREEVLAEIQRFAEEQRIRELADEHENECYEDEGEAAYGRED